MTGKQADLLKFPWLPSYPLNNESIDGQIHSWGQSSYEPVKAVQNDRGNCGDMRRKESPLPWSMVEDSCHHRNKSFRTINNCIQSSSFPRYKLSIFIKSYQKLYYREWTYILTNLFEQPQWISSLPCQIKNSPKALWIHLITSFIKRQRKRFFLVTF